MQKRNAITLKIINNIFLATTAVESLNILKSRLNATEQDIVGIPLQCLLLGQVFEEEALSYANSELISIPPITFHSITHLYKNLIGKKFEKYFKRCGKTNDEKTTKSLMNMHVRLSIELIFPDFVDKLNGVLVPVEMDEILNVGILERASSEKFLRFLHRTFAEYLIAWAVLDMMNHHEWNVNIIEFLFSRVLYCEEGGNEFFDYRYDQLSFDVWYPTYKRFKFASPAIADFFNCLVIDSIETLPPSPSHQLFKNIIDFHTVATQLTRACTFHNFLNILKFLDYIKPFDNHSTVTLYDSRCLFLAIHHSELELAKFVLEHFEDHHKFNLNLQIQTLHLAVSRGEFSIVEFILNEQGLRSTIKNLTVGESLTQEMLHACVKNSDTGSTLDISNRVQILRTLVGMNKDLLEQISLCGNLPLLEEHVHVKLRTELIQLGANVLAQDLAGFTILHKIVADGDKVSKQDYHTFLNNISGSNLRKLVRVKLSDKSTPLIKLVEDIDPLPETLSAYKNAAADFNLADKNGFSILAIAVKCGRNKDTLICLIEHGSNVNWKNRNGYTLLHVAAEYGNVEAAQFFESNRLDPNAENKCGETPLDLALKMALENYQNPNNFIESGLILHKMGGRLSKMMIISEGTSPIHVAASKRGIHMDVLQFLLNINVDVNSIDSNGNTPFHCCMRPAEGKHYFAITQSLLQHSGNPNLANKFQETPFHLGLKNGVLDNDTYHLLRSKTSIGFNPPIGHICLIFIIQHAHDNIESEINLFEQECTKDGFKLDWNYKDEDGNSLLHQAVQYQYENAIKYLVEKKGLQTTSKNNLNQTVLHATVTRKQTYLNMDILEYLLEHGADVYAKDESGFTFLHQFIIRSSHSDTDHRNLNNIIQFLARKRYCSLLDTAGGEHDVTSLHMLVQLSVFPENLLTLLKDKGVNLNSLDKNGNSILHYAIQGKRTTHFISNLIRAGDDIKILNGQKHSLLHSSAQFGNLETFKFYLELGELDINGVDKDGNTPLHCAILQSSKLLILEKCKLLIGWGVDIMAKNEEGMTPLTLAMRRNVHDSELRRILDKKMTSVKYGESANAAHIMYEDDKTSMTTDELIVGSEECPISKVASFIKSSAAFSEFDDKWPNIACDLETRRTDVLKLRKDLLLDKIGLIDVVYELLEEWVARESTNATLQGLCFVLENNGMKCSAESVNIGIKDLQNHKKNI